MAQVEWRIFRLPEVQCLIANWVSFGLLNYSMLNLGARLPNCLYVADQLIYVCLVGPTFYMGKLDCTPLQWGAQLSIVNATSIPFGAKHVKQQKQQPKRIAERFFAACCSNGLKRKHARRACLLSQDFCLEWWSRF